MTDAALRIIATRGIAALSTRALADEVGLTTGAIFKHFSSLDALLDAVVARVEAVLDSTYPSPELPPLEQVLAFVEARSATVGSQLGIHRLVMSEQFQLALPEGASARLAGCVMKSRAFLRDRLAEAQTRGEIRADVAPEIMALVVMGTTQVLALTAGISRGMGAAQRPLVLQGLRALFGAEAERASTRKKGGS
ncbi:MAG: TetR/AcrR family transcriptional regulator [Polyangiaceae bacterium]